MIEYHVPRVALGLFDNGVVTIRGLGVTNVEDPLPVTARYNNAGFSVAGRVIELSPACRLIARCAIWCSRRSS
jgi:hypothetical protein